MGSQTTRLMVSTAASILAVLFQLGATISPLWFNRSDKFPKYFGGLWFSVFCRKEDEPCVVDGYDPNLDSFDFTHSGFWLYELARWALFTGTLFALIVVLQLVVCICLHGSTRGSYILSAVLLILSALLHIAVVCGSIGFVDSFRWCILMSGVGGLFAFIAFIALFVALCNWHRYDERGSPHYQEREGVPMGYSSSKQGYDNPRYDRNW